MIYDRATTPMGEIEHPRKSYPPSKAERQILLGAQPWSLTGRENTVVPLWWILPEIQPLRDWGELFTGKYITGHSDPLSYKTTWEGVGAWHWY